MKICAILSILAVFILAYSSPAFGYVVTVEVEGVVTYVETYGGLELDGSVSMGSVMTSSVTYDSEEPDGAGADDRGTYWLNSISMSVGSYTFTDDPEDAEDLIFIISAEHGWFRYRIFDFPGFDPLFYGPCYLNGQPTTLEDLDLPTRAMEICLEGDNDGTITDALPNEDTFPDLSAFTKARFWAGNDIEPSFGISADITSITVIPEPGTLFLFGLGGLALLRTRKR